MLFFNSKNYKLFFTMLFFNSKNYWHFKNNSTANENQIHWWILI